MWLRSTLEAPLRISRRLPKLLYIEVSEYLPHTYHPPYPVKLTTKAALVSLSPTILSQDVFSPNGRTTW